MFGEGPIIFDHNRLPFNVSLESIAGYEFSQAGYEYSGVGMRITLRRNNLGLLIGGYFGPTIIFSLLSLVSFTINPDIVSFKVASQFHFIFDNQLILISLYLGSRTPWIIDNS